MNNQKLRITFPNQETYTGDLLALGYRRIATLRAQKAPSKNLHMRAAAIVEWVYVDLDWSALIPYLDTVPDPKSRYYPTMWSAGKVTVTYR
jgi:hypothetical protein